MSTTIYLRPETQVRIIRRERGELNPNAVQDYICSYAEVAEGDLISTSHGTISATIQLLDGELPEADDRAIQICPHGRAFVRTLEDWEREDMATQLSM